MACFAAPMAVYYLWNVRYVGWLVSRNASEGGVGETTASMGAVVINGIKILLGRPVTGFLPSANPSSARRWPIWATSSGPATANLGMIGQGRNIVVLIAVVFVVALATAVPAVCGCASAAWVCCPLSAFWGITSNWRSATVLSLSRSRRSGWKIITVTSKVITLVGS